MVQIMGVEAYSSVMLIFTIISTIVSSLVWFIAVPYFALKFGKPISRHKFFRNMIIYSLFILACKILLAVAQYNFVKETVSTLAQESLNRILYVGIGKGVVVTFVFFVISYTALKFTKFVDVKMPKEFTIVKPVKATVIEVDSNTAVEYNEKRYVLSKAFKFNLRDKAKVRIIEDKEDCYLA